MTHSTPAAAIQVLVVEDDPVARRAHGTYVGRVPGFEVAGSAGSAREAIRLLSELAVDLVLLDMNLPDGHGLDILRALRAAGHGCDVIAVTAARDAAVVRRAATQGVSLYLLKPFTFAAFRARLEQYAAYRTRLSGTEGEFAQEDVDGLFGAGSATSAPTAVTPKGLGAETLRQVEQAVRAASAPCSAGEVAAAVGASRVTARRYLEYLADEGVVTRSIRYGGRGRPEVQYAPAAPSGR